MITIIDYQMGNLRSVQKGFAKVGHEAQISSDPDLVAAADRLVLPGVGAFPDAMNELEKRGLVEPIKEFAASGKPFLGICLGLQLLFDVGYEGERRAGLGIVHGEVIKFELPQGFKVPHMGWNGVDIQEDCPLMADLASGTHFYFVHSYYVVPTNQSVVATTTDYYRPFCSMIRRDNVFASQFHPEKSQRDGLKMLQNFAELS